MEGLHSKHLEDKKTIKKLTKKISKSGQEFDQLASQNSKILKEKSDLKLKYQKLREKSKKDEEIIRDLNKKLYKMEAQDDLINVNPYDLHMKIRYYETQLDQKDQE